MMRRLVVLVLLAVVAPVAAAQLPPSINKPIEQARKNANATNAQMSGTERANQPAPAATRAAARAAPPSAATSAAGQAPVARPTPTAPTPPRAASQDANRITFEREVFTYVTGGRRDPFASPIETGEIRPLIADLVLTGIIFDATGRNSVAVMRDQSTKELYRVKAGQMLGRAKVAQIRPQEVIMTIDEYGFSRQEILTLNVQQTQQTKRTP